MRNNACSTSANALSIFSRDTQARTSARKARICCV
jgi:hypothetical protein